MKYALDTNIITYYLKGNEKILDKVDKEAENNYILVSNNQKHFEKIENIQVVNWTS